MTGGVWSRLGYPAGQISGPPYDSGHGRFNFSEAKGNLTAVAISMAYYESRDLTSGISKRGSRLGVKYSRRVLPGSGVKFWTAHVRKTLTPGGWAAPD